MLAANVTKSGKIIIHTTNHAIAAEVQARPQLVHECSGVIPDFARPSDHPVLDIDIPWHGVVIHNLPAASLRDAFESTDDDNIWKLLETKGGVAQKDI